MSYMNLLQSSLRNVDFGNSLSYEENIAILIKYFISVRMRNSLVYFIGNGGSAGIAIHMTSDFLKNGCMRTHSMHDPSTLTCLGNDFGYAAVFSKQLEILAVSGDFLIAISSSGESENILNAVSVAKEKECGILTLTGFDSENRLRRMGDYNIHVPCSEYGIVESVHHLILQQIVDGILKYDGENGGTPK